VAGQLNTEEEDANCKPKVMKRRSVCHCSPISITEHYTQLSTFVKYQNVIWNVNGEYFSHSGWLSCLLILPCIKKIMLCSSHKLKSQNYDKRIDNKLTKRS